MTQTRKQTKPGQINSRNRVRIAGGGSIPVESVPIKQDSTIEIGETQKLVSSRDQHGYWLSGVSGNPGGKPKQTIASIFRTADPKVIADEIWRIAFDRDLDPRLRLAALTEIRDTRDGKPTQSIDVEVSPGESVIEALLHRILPQDTLELPQGSEPTLIDIEGTDTVILPPTNRGRPKGSRDQTPRDR